MPGSAQCARCGGTLRLSAIAISIDPPRATIWQKRLRRMIPWRARGLAYRANAAGQRIDLRLPNPRMLPRLLVPGLAQLSLGRRGRGWGIFAAYVAALLFGIASWGSLPGSIALGLAVSLHSLSCVDALLLDRATSRQGPMAVATIACAGIVGVYFGAGRLVTGAIEPIRLVEVTAPFRSGDTLLVNRRAYRTADPRPGDVALYRISDAMLRGERGIYPVRVTGSRIDRILALSGQRIRWTDGQLFINGKRSALAPLNPRAMPARFELTVPANHVAILPSTDPQFGRLAASRLLHQVMLVPRTNLAGRVIARHYPIWRFWWIR